MNSVYSLLERHGLITADQIESAAKRWTQKQAHDLRDELFEALSAEKAAVSSPKSDITIGKFRFFASASIRGDFGCEESYCRIAKAANLARYAALYCETVFVPVRLDMHEHGNEDNGAWFRSHLAGTVLSLNELRPASESGIVKLVPEGLFFCQNCEREASQNFTESAEVAKQFLLKNEKEFTAEYFPPNDDLPLPRVVIKGPEEYLEHGQIVRIYSMLPQWAQELQSQGGKTSSYQLGETEIRKSGVVRSILSALAGDAAFQHSYALRYGAKCLTNLEGQAQVLRAFNDDDYMAQCTSVLLANMTHSVPMLDELPIATAVRIRKEDPESFLRYRAAIGKVFSDYVESKKFVNPREAKGIYTDILLPEVLRLKAQVKSLRKSNIKEAAKKLTFSAAVVTIGLIGGLPAQIAAALKVAGTTNLLRDAHDIFSRADKSSSDVKNENFYFLLRLLEEKE
ncbi:MAG TPA: hypothetical protein VN025_17295 [Candidatus Dormibacteraeota bacterium]|jgi:hypothetical protein|nr:hypothetical protein [Candidatus Dormibacteraeota bacterium]